ncbi:hypothetical protein MRB53_041318 [Persea americana]|nr:hypothetical protein MRB53_041318 [Persea americana]
MTVMQIPPPLPYISQPRTLIYQKQTGQTEPSPSSAQPHPSFSSPVRSPYLLHTHLPRNAPDRAARIREAKNRQRAMICDIAGRLGYADVHPREGGERVGDGIGGRAERRGKSGVVMVGEVGLGMGERGGKTGWSGVGVDGMSGVAECNEHG